jgi:hypothetical protein
MKGKEEETTVGPGTKVPDSGIYESESGRRATLVEGKPAPPTPKEGEIWTQVIDTNPENNKK